MKETFEIFVDGIPKEVQKGSMLLENIRAMGICIPTLCHHSSLEPNGECRLCLVEITHPDWNGWSNLVTSCLYPVAPGLQVSTRSERVRQVRRTLLELYMAQYPGAEKLQEIARDEGVDTTPFPLKEGADTCVLCGLCTRVCQNLSVGAIAPLSRGTEKFVGPNPDLEGEDCTGCGACSFVCPTGAIRMEHKDRKFFIWNREFDIPICTVKPELCRGCGICEEVCPWDIPRVTTFKTGSVASTITPSYCTGCGICAGACPTGAIEQDAFPDSALSGYALNPDDLKGQTIVFACSRSAFPDYTEGVIPVPCIGRVTVENMLECMARGADGVLLVCRDQATCPSGFGGKLGEERVKVADELCASAGLGHGHIRYEKPAYGLDGPAKTAAAFKTSLNATPLQQFYKKQKQDAGGMDRALNIMNWFRNRPELTPVLPHSIDNIFAPAENDTDFLLYLGDLPDLDLLLSLLVKGWRLKDVFQEAAGLLGQKGIRFRPVISIRQVKESSASRLVTFCSSEIDGLDRRMERQTLDELAGNKPSDSIKNVCDFHFQISQKERREIITALKDGMGLQNNPCPHEIAQYKLLNRQGAWLEVLSSDPVLVFSDTVRNISGDKGA